MKRLTKSTLLLSALTLMLSGCYLKSVHPLVKPDESNTVDGLSGSWHSDDETWTFLHSDEDYKKYFPSEEEVSLGFDDEQHPYLIVIETDYEEGQDEETVYFWGSFISINGSYFMDLKPLDVDYKEETFHMESTIYSNHLFPVHTFSRIELNQDSLNIETFKDTWIKELIEDNRVRIKHEKTEDGILLTASTKELQKFIEKYGGSEKAYEGPMTLIRK